MGLDLPNINFDLNAVKGFFKKNKMLVLPISICIIAFLMIIPTRLVGNSIKKSMKTGVSQSKTLSRMIYSDTSYSRDQVSVAEQQLSLYKRDKNRVVSLARQSTQREPISYDVFPKPISKSQQIYSNFSKNYRSSIEALLTRIRALDAPTENEKGRATSHLNKRATPRKTGHYAHKRPQNDSFNAVIDAFCEKRAASIPVYVNASVFKWYDFWKGFSFDGEDSAVRDCWSSQLAFWVYEDIISTIEVLNSDSNSVSSSPVKRLMGVGFDTIVKSESTSGGSRPGAGRSPFAVRSRPSSASSSPGERDVPEYVLESKGNLVPDNWTGRTSNKKIDVIQFSFSVILDSASVPVFIKELCSDKTHKFKTGYSNRGQESEYKHNQISILRYSLGPIERQDPVHADYRYGNHSVVTLSFVCEYVFHKDGYNKIMPEQIKKDIAPPTAGTTGMGHEM